MRGSTLRHAVHVTARLIDSYDSLIFDLDGVLYVGSDAVPHSVASVTSVARSGCEVWYATNNASRSADAVAGHLRQLGFPVAERQVVTSAAVAARVAATTFPQMRRVRVLGSPSLSQLMVAQGFHVLGEADPTAADLVIQGHDPTMTWARLSRGLNDLVAGATWVATNTDSTLPLPGGLGVGNGAFVAALSAASGRAPDVIAGKPHPPMLDHIVSASTAGRHLVIGDRFDTDVEWAVASGLDSLLVDTGVHRIADSAAQGQRSRPTWIGEDLRSLFAPGRHPGDVPHAGARRGE